MRSRQAAGQVFSYAKVVVSSSGTGFFLFSLLSVVQQSQGFSVGRKGSDGLFNRHANG